MNSLNEAEFSEHQRIKSKYFGCIYQSIDLNDYFWFYHQTQLIYYELILCL